ncbi:hypothetical protein [Botrimarina hoheduenensis]|uniref:PEP-CTERM protein-sorting domain-containing protein n=1 Tax=Botrimarina hoheduenensis TaxID=2528000 RepID=A0A5C5WAU7_9BACT|nr:hypothetical protein [Botrimarina hoheduenensis]TWT47199.1 hypothetical protein Pla111_08110 [Botrimarina hoheduenensis]
MPKTVRHHLPWLASFLVVCLNSVAFGQFTTAPSTFSTTIQVQGELEGTEFDDWNGIPVAYSDPADNPGSFEGRDFMDFANVQIANDDEYLYLRLTYHNASSANTFIGIDIDQNTSTGFDLFGLGLIGSDLGYQNDFPFQQIAGFFNLGVSLTGGPLGNGGALIYPFFDQDGPSKEWAISLETMFTFAVGTPPSFSAFPQDSIDILFWTEEGAGDITDVISYTLATQPVVEGDYNGDSVVDVADYTVWRDSLNDIGVDLPADGNGDQIVDQEDYNYWVMRYGTGLSTSATSIPEPTAAVLAALLAFATAVQRR